MKAERVGVNLSGLDQFKASALLVDPVAGADGAPMRVLLASIDFDPQQPRRNLDPVALAELAETIKAQGVLERVSLRRHPDHDVRYIVNRGERRVRASLLARLVDIPAFIDERLDRYAQAVETSSARTCRCSTWPRSLPNASGTGMRVRRLRAGSASRGRSSPKWPA